MSAFIKIRRTILVLGSIFLIFLTLSLVTFHVLYVLDDNYIILNEWETDLNGEWDKTQIPIMVLKPATEIINIRTKIFMNSTKDYYLVIPMVFANRLEVFVNNDRMATFGDVGEYHNFLYKTFLINVKLVEGENEIKIRIYTFYKFNVKYPIYLSEKAPYLRVGFLNFMFYFFPILSIGSSSLTALFLMLLYLKRRRNYLFYFSISFIGVMFYLLAFVDYGYPMPKDALKNWLKFFVGVMNITFPMFLAGVDSVNYGNLRKFTKIIIILSLFVAAIPWFIPNFSDSMKVLMPFSAFLNVLCAFSIVKHVFISEYIEFQIVGFVILLSVFQHTFTILNLIPIPSLLFIAVMIWMVAFVYYTSNEYKNIEEELFETKRELFTDPLTGAYNRRYLELVEVSKKDSVAFVDLDDLKKVNDEFGHEAGDEILKKFVSCAKNYIRESDELIRFGGDEFIVILKGCDTNNAKRILNKIINSFKNTTGRSASYGISKGYPNIEKSIKKADAKMYEMKTKKKRNYPERS